MLLGNNCELDDKRQVSRERAEQVIVTRSLSVCLSVCSLSATQMAVPPNTPLNTADSRAIPLTVSDHFSLSS